MRMKTAFVGVLLVGLIAGLTYVLLNTGATPPAPTRETARQPSPEPPAPATEEPAPEAAPLPAEEVRPPTAAVEKPGSQPQSAPEGEPEGASVSGTVHTQTGAPIEDAKVRAFTRPSPFVRGMEPLDLVAHADASGRFSFTGIDPGYRRVIVEVEARGFHRDAASVQLGGSIAFVLGPPGVLRGRVTFAGEGTPCDGATVSIGTMRGVTAALAATTDADGRYRIESIKPETYRVFVRAEDVPFSLPTTSVVIESGRETIGNFEVKRGIVLRGRVVDATTRVPIRGVEVTDMMNPRRRTVLTDADGRFTLGPLARHSRLVFKAEGYMSVTRPLDPAPKDGEPAGAIQEFGLARAASVKGRVLGPDGQPVAGARVRTAAGFPGAMDRTESGEDGTFQLNTVPQGTEVRLVAEKTGFARAILGPLNLSAGAPGTEIVLRLGKGGMVSGRLTDATGAPITEGRVHLNPRPGNYGSQCSASPDKDGNFRIETVPAGRYDLEVWVRDYVGPKRPDFLVEEGAEYRGVDFVLERGLTITGVVVDQAGNPVADASLHAVPISPREDQTRGFRTARTDADGRFTLAALGSGMHGILVRREGYRQEDSRTQIRAGEQDVVLRAIRLHEGIVGHVVNEETGAPETRFFVRWYQDERAMTREFTDQEGRFQIQGLAPGVCYLEAGTKDGLVSRQPVRVELRDGSAPVPIELRVTAGGAVTCRVLSPDGAALAQARVEIVRTGGEPTGVTGRAITDPDGRCSIKSLAPGEYAARASHGDWIEVERAVTIRHGRESHVELKLETDGGVFEICVKDPRGRPVEGATLRVMRPNGSTVPADQTKYARLFRERRKSSPDLDYEAFHARHYRTDADGMVEWRFLPAGRFVLEVHKAGYRAGRLEAESFPGVTARLTITLEPAG